MITTTYSGDNKYASKVEKNGNITVVHNPKVNLDIENITMIYKRWHKINS